MTTGEKIGLAILGAVVLGGGYIYISKKKAAAAQAAANAAASNQPAAPSDMVMSAVSQYAINPLDLAYATKAAQIIEGTSGYNTWGGWWFADLPAYMPSGSRDSYVTANSKGQKTLTERLAASTNELAASNSTTNWKTSGSDTQLYNLVQELNAKLAFGQTS